MSALRKDFFLKKDKILRYVFYKMTDKDLFLRYSDLKKKHDDSLKENEDK
jgi:hypothetical protein